MKDFIGQQHLPGLDLRWLTDCANCVNDARHEIEHMAKLADQDALEPLRDALIVAREAMMVAERMAAELARKHKASRGLVGDTERDGPRFMMAISSESDVKSEPLTSSSSPSTPPAKIAAP